MIIQIETCIGNYLLRHAVNPSMGLAPASLRVTVSASSYQHISLAVNGTAVIQYKSLLFVLMLIMFAIIS